MRKRWLLVFALLRFAGFSAILLASAAQAATLDKYGGDANLPCTNGSKPHFYTQKMGGRWYLCDPAGNAFFMKAVYGVNNTITQSADFQGVTLPNAIAQKYATGAALNPTGNWAIQTVDRLQAWGFDTTAEYQSNYVRPTIADAGTYATPDNTIPVKMPFVIILEVSHYAEVNDGNYANGPVKDLMYGVTKTAYNGYRYQFIDSFDPNFSQLLQGELANDYSTYHSLHGPNNDYVIAVDVDESDNTGGVRAGPDFPTVDDQNALALDAGHTTLQVGWVVLVTAPTQASNSTLGETYNDQTVYSKAALGTWLASRYGNSISALNTAWGSHYTSFGSAGGFGVGTGVLDEDGTCPSRGGSACWVGDPVTLAGETSTMQADMSAFMTYYLDFYFSTIKSAYQAAVPGIMLMEELGGWGSPPRKEVLQEASKYLDLFTFEEIPPECQNCTDIQARIDFAAQYGGDKPWLNWEGWMAQLDSYFATDPASDAQGFDQSSAAKTQAQRGQFYQQMVQAGLNAKDSTTGTYHIVGFQWWSYYDNSDSNWGLVTPRDNAYDGVEARSGKQPCSPEQPVSGYSCGGELTNYGNFIGPVTTANQGIYPFLEGQSVNGSYLSLSSNLTFTAANGSNPASQTLTISNTGTGSTAMTWTAASTNTWVGLSPASGSLGSGANTSVTVSINTSGLAVGTYTGLITVTSNASDSPQTVTVSLTVTAGQAPSPTITSFTASPASITSGQSSTLAWSTTNATALSINQGVGTVTGKTSTAVSPAATTIYTLTASNGSTQVTQTVTVTVTPAADTTPPSVTAGPTATPSPVTGKTTALTVSATDNVTPSSQLVYQWVALSPPAAVTFSANNSNAAASTTATFQKSGSYTIQVAVKDLAGNTTTKSVAITVNQTLTTLTVAPDSPTVTASQTQQFGVTAKDQFGNAMTASNPAWSVTSGGGSINSSGLYTAGSTVGTYTVKALSGSVSDTTLVTVTATPTVNAPVISPSGGTYQGSVQVTISEGTSGAAVYYTTDGTTPDATATLYTGPIMLSAGATVKAIGILSGMSNSSVSNAIYTITSIPVQGTPPVGSNAFPNGIVSGTYQVISLMTDENADCKYDVISGTPYNQMPFTFLATGGTFHSQPVMNLAVGSSYSYFVRCVDTQGDVDTTDYPISFTVGANTGGLPTPDLSNLPSVDPITGTITVGYAAGYSNLSFVWTLVPVNANGSSARESFSAMSAAGVSQQTLSSTMSFGRFGSLTPGSYTLSVYTTDGTNVSATASKMVTLVFGDLNNIRVYPNPWRSDKGYVPKITFDQMAQGSTVKVFTVSGHLVKSLDGGSGAATWDLTTDSGDKAASGIYIYLITDGQGSKVRGKVAVIK